MENIERDEISRIEILLTRERPGGRIRPPQFFLNKVRSRTGIKTKLGTLFLSSILRPYTKFWGKNHEK